MDQAAAPEVARAWAHHRRHMPNPKIGVTARSSRCVKLKSMKRRHAPSIGTALSSAPKRHMDCAPLVDQCITTGGLSNDVLPRYDLHCSSVTPEMTPSASVPPPASLLLTVSAGTWLLAFHGSL